MPAGASPYGAMDMAGNAWEWVLDFNKPLGGSAFASKKYLSISAIPPETFCSSNWKGEQHDCYVLLESHFRVLYNSIKNDDNIGFRCALDASP